MTRLSKETKAIWKIDRKPKSGRSASKSIIIHIGEGAPEVPGVSKSISPNHSDEKKMTRLISSLKGEGYQIDMTDKRIRTRVLNVLDWAVRNAGNKRRLSKKYLDLVFGQQQNPLSQYLRDTLLVKARGHCKSKSKSTEWNIHPKSVEKMWLEVNGSPINLEVEQLAAWTNLANQHQDSNFEYSEPTLGGRRYHELQQMPKNIKKQVYVGFFDYDLSAANVTLISQMAQIAAHDKGDDFETPRIDKYLAQKGAYRAQVAKLFNISAPECKELMQCIFSLAYIDENMNSHAFTILGTKLAHFMNHPHFQELREEISECWKVIMGKDWADGEKRFREYEKLERQIIDAVEAQLKGKKYLLQHDGFLLLEKEPLDMDYITRQVLAKTGLDVKLDEVQL